MPNAISDRWWFPIKEISTKKINDHVPFKPRHFFRWITMFLSFFKTVNYVFISGENSATPMNCHSKHLLRAKRHVNSTIKRGKNGFAGNFALKTLLSPSCQEAVDFSSRDVYQTCWENAIFLLAQAEFNANSSFFSFSHLLASIRLFMFLKDSKCR